MNTVILTSVLSAGNHALFAGTRVLYGLAAAHPTPHAPALFRRTTPRGVPLPALLATSSVSVVCFGASFVGQGTLWGWLQNIVGVSNQVSAPRSADEMRGRAADHWPPAALDRVAVDRDRQLALPPRVDPAGPLVRRDEVPRRLDVAMGASLRHCLRHAPDPQ
jgi:hypothetical protein